MLHDDDPNIRAVAAIALAKAGTHILYLPVQEYYHFTIMGFIMKNKLNIVKTDTSLSICSGESREERVCNCA